MKNRTLVYLVESVIRDAELVEIYIQDDAFNSAEACLTHLEESAAYLRNHLDKQIKENNMIKVARAAQENEADAAC